MHNLAHSRIFSEMFSASNIEMEFVAIVEKVGIIATSERCQILILFL